MSKNLTQKTFLVVLSFIFVCAQSVNVLAQTKPDISTPESFLNYLCAQRSNVALTSFTIRPNGSIDLNDPVIAHNIDVRMPLESLGKVLHLAAYAKAVAQGEIKADRTVTLREWENYYLPGTDGGAHGAALEELEIPIDEFGFAKDPDVTVTVDQMVRAMIRFSDNAVHDWLFANLKAQTFREVIRDGGLSGHDFPGYFLGNDLSYENHEIGLSSAKNVQALKRLPARKYVALVNRLTAKFQDPAWRLAEFQWRLANAEQLGNAEFLRQGGVTLSTKGTVRDYASMMARVLTGTFLSREISTTMRRFLEQTLAFELFGEADLYSVAGEKTGGSSGGFLTNANYTIPKAGDFAGKRRITVLFQQLIATDILTEQLTTLIPFKFESKLARDRNFAKQVRRTFHNF